MKDTIIGVTFFILAVSIQIVLHRIFLIYKTRTLKTFFTYPLILLLVIIFPFYISFNSIVLFILLSIIAFILFITPILGDTPPTSKIMMLLQRHKRVSYGAIVRLFSNEETIIKRLHDVASWEFIEVKNHRYKVTLKGLILATCFRWYLDVLQWTPNV